MVQFSACPLVLDVKLGALDLGDVVQELDKWCLVVFVLQCGLVLELKDMKRNGPGGIISATEHAGWDHHFRAVCLMRGLGRVSVDSVSMHP